MPSYIKATVSLASYTFGTAVASTFTNAGSTSDWTVNGSGGLVYGGSSATTVYISIDYKQASSTGTSTNRDVFILRNADLYPALTLTMPWAATAFSKSVTSTIPIICNPGDIFYFRVDTSGANAGTTVVITLNFASIGR